MQIQKMCGALQGIPSLLVLFDLATGCLGAYPVKTKGASEVLQSIVHFTGGAPVRAVYSDRAPTLIRAVKALPGPPAHTSSIPGVPQTNSIAESRVKILSGVSG